MRINIGMPVVRTDGRSVGHVITKFSGMGRFIDPWCSANKTSAVHSPSINASESLSVVTFFFQEFSSKCLSTGLRILIRFPEDDWK